MIKNCPICLKDFETAWTPQKSCSVECSSISISQQRTNIEKERKVLREIEYAKCPKKCRQCDKILPRRSTNIFCGRKCAGVFNNIQRKINGFILSVESIKRISVAVIEYNKNKSKYTKIKLNNCELCNEKFYTKYKTKRRYCFNIKCIKEIQSQNGRINANNRVKRSRAEIELYDLCKNVFCNVTHNRIISSGWDADIILEEERIAIMWDGPWHYKQMPHKNHSLKQVQRRDKIKKKLFESLGWTVVSFQDRHYTPITALQELKKLVGLE